MISATGSPYRRYTQQGFTLVELIVVMTILGLIMAISIPAVDNAMDERDARRPVVELALLARKVRNLALAERHPYQIVFTPQGFQATRYYNPYGGLEEFDQLRLQIDELERRRKLIQASEQRSGAEVEDASTESIFYQEVKIDERYDYGVISLGELDWIPITNGGNFHRWIFQPSGMCEPFKIKMQSDNAFFEVEFHPLTAEIKDETSWVE